MASVFIHTETLPDVETPVGFAGPDRALTFCSKNVRNIFNADALVGIPNPTTPTAYISVFIYDHRTGTYGFDPKGLQVNLSALK